MTSLEPGAELDARVAEALGWESFASLKDMGKVYTLGDNPGLSDDGLCGRRDFVPAYSTSPGDAIAALEEFCRKHGFSCQLEFDIRWVVAIRIRGGELVDVKKISLPRAICLAILAANEKLKGAAS